MAWIWFLPAFLSEWMMQRWDEQEGEGEDDATKRQIGTIFAYPLSGVIGVRDLANFMVNDRFGYDLSPIADGLETTVRLGRDIMEGEFDRQTARRATMTMGYWFALPARQVWNTGEYLIDSASGDTDGFSLFDMLVRRTDR